MNKHEPVDLDGLDALHAAATEGEWTVSFEELDTDGTVISGKISIPAYDNAEYIAALHNAYPAMAAELRALREQIGMIREYNQALRQERDALRADYRQLEKVRQDCLRRCERMKSLEGLSLDEIAARQLEREDTLRAEVARLREALECIPVDLIHAIENGDTGADVFLSTGSCKLIGAALSSTPATAEWLAARDAEQRRMGAAEWLEKEAWKARQDMGEFYERSVDGMLEEASELRKGE